MMDGFPGNLQQLFQQAQNMQKEVARMQEELQQKTVESSAGGGMVTAVVNGAQQLVSIRIDPAVVSASDVPMLQDLVTAAVNEGLRRSKELFKDEISKITGGIPIPGFGS